jgi:hypothetical protein
MMDDEHSAIRGRLAKLGGQGLQLRVVQPAVILTGDTRVKADESETSDADDLVDRAGRRLSSEQVLAKKPYIVVIARRDQQLGVKSPQSGIDHRTQLRVALCRAAIGQVAREHQHVRRAFSRGDHLDRRLNPSVAVAVEGPTGCDCHSPRAGLVAIR